MRARNIKPGFFENEVLSELPAHTRLLYIGLWCYADREGRFEWKPKRIKAVIFPYENIDVEPMLMSLHVMSFLDMYRHCNDIYGQIRKFKEHQHPHPHEQKSKIPCFYDCEAIFPENSQNVITCNDNVITCQDKYINKDIINKDIINKDIPLSNPENDIPDLKQNLLRNPGENKKNRKPISLPPDFSVSDRIKDVCAKEGYTNLPLRLEKFLEWVEDSKNRGIQRKYIDWDRVFLKAVREDWAKLNNNKIIHRPELKRVSDSQDPDFWKQGLTV